MTGHPLPPGPDQALAWVEEHLAGLWTGSLTASPRFRGGRDPALRALGGLDVRGYAGTRSQVWPPSGRGASALSPYIRHGLLSLGEVWHHVEGGPARDVAKYRDELAWQEYARHVYARLGPATGEPLRMAPPVGRAEGDPWSSDMNCMHQTVTELERDGWLVNQTRMWLASQWSVRSGRDWRQGEDRFFAHLLDGSRAANRLGWQWTIGTATGKAYGFSRWQVEKRAPQWCAGCARRQDCPIQHWPEVDGPVPQPVDPRILRDVDLASTAGPVAVEGSGADGAEGAVGVPDAVWLTAESLGDVDPALSAHPSLPAVFVFDAGLLGRVRVTSKRLVFLVEALVDLAGRRPVEVHVGDPADILAGRRLAATFTPVPGWKRIRRHLEVVECHPWPWLVRPGPGSVASYSAWRRAVDGPGGRLAPSAPISSSTDNRDYPH